MLLHAHDRTITPVIRDAGTWEPEEAAFLRAVIRRGHVVLDVGANVGYFTLLAAHAVGTEGAVVAVEPEPRNLRQPRANVWRHGLENVTVLAAAAGLDRGFLGLHEYVKDNTGSYQARAVWAPDEQPVPKVALRPRMRR